MSDDLAAFVAFVAARLDEDEAAAKAAASVAGPDWVFAGVGEDGYDGYLRTPDGTIMADALNPEDEEFRPFAARFDPARALREVAAKRAIAREHPPQQMRYIESSRCPQCEVPWPCPTLRALAAAWSDHPGYRAAWKP